MHTQGSQGRSSRHLAKAEEKFVRVLTVLETMVIYMFSLLQAGPKNYIII